MSRDPSSGFNAEVLVVPIALRFATPQAPGDDFQPWLKGVVEADKPELLTFVESGRWPAEPLESGRAPRDIALAVATRLAPSLFGRSGFGEPEVHAAGFIEPVEPGAPTRLLYTFAAPVSIAELDPDRSGEWRNMHRDAEELPRPADVRDMVRNFWRQEMEETTRGLDLLPRFFTMTQILEAYMAVWDKDLDWSNFSNWVNKRNRGMVKEAAEGDVRAQRDFILAQAGAPGAITGTAVGASVLALPLAAGMLASNVVMGVAVAAGRAAYQQRKGKGPSPKWYERTDGGRAIRLDDIFGPRPRWLEGELGAANVEASN